MTLYFDPPGPSVRTLENLERGATECAQVFSLACDQVMAEDLRALLARRSQEHRAAAALLRAHARRLGAPSQAGLAVQPAPSATAALPTPWHASRSLRAEAIDALVLEQCERAEDDLLEAMGDALSGKLEPASALAIEQLRVQTRTQHLLLRAMRDRLRPLLWQPLRPSEVLTPEQQGLALLQQQLTGATKGQQHLGRHMAER